MSISDVLYLLLTSLLSQDHVKIDCALWMTKQWVPKRPIQRRKTVCRMAVASQLTVILSVALVGPLAVVVLTLIVVLCALLCRRGWVVVLQHMETSHPFYDSYSTVSPICFVAVLFITFSNGTQLRPKDAYIVRLMAQITQISNNATKKLNRHILFCTCTVKPYSVDTEFIATELAFCTVYTCSSWERSSRCCWLNTTYTLVEDAATVVSFSSPEDCDLLANKQQLFNLSRR